MLAEIVVLRNHQNIDQFYTYYVPKEFLSLIAIGSRVLVSFGPKEHIEGIVFNLIEGEAESNKIKPILYCFNDGIYLTSCELNVIEWLKEYYLCTYTEAIQLFLPSNTITTTKTLYELNEESNKKIIEDQTTKLSPTDQLILSQVMTLSPIDSDDIDVETSSATKQKSLKKLLALGLITSKIVFESNVKDRYIQKYKVDFSKLDKVKDMPDHHVAKKRLLSYLMDHPEGLLSDFKIVLKASPSVINYFTSNGFLKIEHVENKRLPLFMESTVKRNVLKLNEEQSAAYRCIIEEFESKRVDDFLVHGITGSGKTELYAELIRYTLKRGQRVIMLVPEIALTPQIVSRFVEQFGKDKIALLHSKITPGERHDQWKAIREGQYPLIIGARSAIFAPADDIGLIIIDEEHEHTYRSEKRPRYDTYEVAKHRISINGGMIVSGSATPAIVSYYEALTGKRKLIKLMQRYNDAKLPTFDIVDMREELSNGNRSILSKTLYESIAQRLESKEQCILFLNRTGHSTFVSCRSCGFTLTCPNCDITLTFFKSEKSVRCHYCGHQSFIPRKCPECESQYFKYFGTGTEKAEELIKEAFPEARVARMDSLSTRKKGSTEQIIEDFETENIDILIGTQMVTKGFDFKNVTLVGILSADVLFNMPYYGASERSYQLVHQVAGRAGRGEKNGEVIVQTYDPDHYAIQDIPYDQFFDMELKYRHALNYPPFMTMVNLVFTSELEATAHHYAEVSHQYLKSRLFKKGLQNTIEIYDVNPALLKKIENKFRWQIIIKCPESQMLSLKFYIKKLQSRFSDIKDCKIIIDLNARNIL